MHVVPSCSCYLPRAPILFPEALSMPARSRFCFPSDFHVQTSGPAPMCLHQAHLSPGPRTRRVPRPRMEQKRGTAKGIRHDFSPAAIGPGLVFFACCIANGCSVSVEHGEHRTTDSQPPLPIGAQNSDEFSACQASTQESRILAEIWSVSSALARQGHRQASSIRKTVSDLCA